MKEIGMRFGMSGNILQGRERIYMRILVVSDTHRDQYSLEQAVLRQPKAEVVIHLGDGADEAEMVKAKFPEKTFLQVRGNCDWGCDLPVEGEITLEGKKLFYTHGHAYNVKYGLYNICCAAREKKADIVLFGHTHQDFCLLYTSDAADD